jgi:hypothetical protein
MLNDIPVIETTDDIIEKRIEYIQFPYVFSENLVDGNSTIKKCIPSFDVIIKEEKFINSFIHILLDGYLKYVQNMPYDYIKIQPKCTKEIDQLNIMAIINKNFDITLNKDDKLPVSILKKFKNENHDIFKNISNAKFYEILRKNGLVEGE